MSKYIIWYRDGVKDKVTEAFTETHLENVCTDLMVGRKEVTAVLEDGKMRTIVDNLRCPYCGGIDAHLWNCKGGYGL